MRNLLGQVVLFCGLILTVDVALARQNGIPDYETARDLLWNELYPEGGSSLYCREHATRSRRFNVEHVFAASWMKKAAGCLGYSREECRKVSELFNAMEGDLHNLFPALATINAARSDFGFTIIPGRATSDCDFEVDRVTRQVEPAPDARGDIARAILYFVVEYDIAWKDLVGLNRRHLHAWHCDDPVSSIEDRRNDVIEELQGNRNPYIDDPNRIDCDSVPDYPVD